MPKAPMTVDHLPGTVGLAGQVQVADGRDHGAGADRQDPAPAARPICGSVACGSPAAVCSATPVASAADHHAPAPGMRSTRTPRRCGRQVPDPSFRSSLLIRRPARADGYRSAFPGRDPLIAQPAPSSAPSERFM